MTLTFSELESTTSAVVKADGGKAWDNFFRTCPATERYLEKKKGLYKVSTGTRIEVPILYNKNASGWYSKGEPISLAQVELVNKAYFDWKHLSSTAVLLQEDEAMNSGEEKEVDMVATQVYGALGALGIDVAEAFWGNTAEGGKSAVGVLTMCSEDADVAYGHLAEDDLVSDDGTKVWEGKTISTAQNVTAPYVRALHDKAEEDLKMGPKGHVSIDITTRTLFRSFKDQLTPAQQLKEDAGTTKAGFQNIVFDGVTMIPDDFCPASHMGTFNDNYIGFEILKGLNFKKGKWHDTTIVKTPGRAMVIFLTLNLITNMRKAHALHTNFS